MTTVFSRIVAGQIPGRFIWSDAACVGFLTIEPIAPGHTLIVPRVEIDHWIDMDRDLTCHIFDVARLVGDGIRYAFDPRRVGLLIQGFEVPHAHIHVWPANSPADFDLANVDRSPNPEDLDDAAHRLRAAISDLGYEDFVPASVHSPDQ